MASCFKPGERTMNKNQATFKVLLLQAEASKLDKTETMAFLSNNGIPLEVITRMNFLWEEVLEIGGQVINIGKIIMMKLIQFIKENPNMVIGLAIGVALGMLANAVPFIGQFIAPILSAVLGTIGMLHGHRLDKIANGEYVGDSLMEDAITITKKFWGLFYEIFNSLMIKPIMARP
jgi:hypothetical protein